MTLDSGEHLLGQLASGECCLGLLDEWDGTPRGSPEPLRFRALLGELAWASLSLTRGLLGPESEGETISGKTQFAH